MAATPEDPLANKVTETGKAKMEEVKRTRHVEVVPEELLVELEHQEEMEVMTRIVVHHHEDHLLLPSRKRMKKNLKKRRTL